MEWGTAVTALGTTTLKEHAVTFGIKDADRTRHLCILGRTGSGRGELVAQMALQDIARGLGVVVLDAAGTVTPLLMERIEPGTADRLIHLDPSDAEYPYTWNPLDELRALPMDEGRARIQGLIESVYRLPTGPLSVSGAEVLAMRTDATLITFYTIATDERARKTFFDGDTDALASFESALADSSDILKDLEEHGRYVAKDTLVRNLLGQRDSKASLAGVPEGAIVIVDFSKIRMFPTRMTPLVRVFVEATRAIAHGTATPVPLYLHDCLRYLGEEDIERAFTDTRVAITVADTIVQEADSERREKALMRCGSVASFAGHPSDRVLLERAFYPYIDPDELVSLERGEFVIALTIDAVRAKPFFGKALPLPAKKNISYQDLIIESRAAYATLRTKVDATFRPPPIMDDDDMNDEGGEGGEGFSDAFRSMFAKKADAPAAPAVEAPTVPATPTPAGDGEAEETKPTDIPEADLKAMLYVKPVNA